MTSVYAAPCSCDATADDVLRDIDVRGKRVVITGGTDGLGRETVRAFARAGAEVIFTTRNAARADAVIDSVKADKPNAAISAMTCDLMSRDSVLAFNAELRTQAPKIDALILNAGVLLPELERNAQGIEAQLMTNLVSQFMIAKAAASALELARPSRLVILTSCAHKGSPFLFDDFNFERTPYDQFLAYAHTKTGASLMAIALNQRLRSRGVLCFAVHPGSIFETGLATHTRASNDAATIEAQAAAMKLGPGDRKNLGQGEATSVWAATDPGLAVTGGGQYLENLRVGIVSDEPSPFRNVAPHALDHADAERLYALLEELSGRA